MPKKRNVIRTRDALAVLTERSMPGQSEYAAWDVGFAMGHGIQIAVGALQRKLRSNFPELDLEEATIAALKDPSTVEATVQELVGRLGEDIEVPQALITENREQMMAALS